jgi:hypothetical protein
LSRRDSGFYLENQQVNELIPVQTKFNLHEAGVPR